MRKFVFLFLAMFSFTAYSQEYNVTVSPSSRKLKEGHLRMGNSGESEHKMVANNLYLSVGGVPVVPVMGELHFSRTSREEWRDYLLKMKANGINIVATYVFWMHHEEAEGIFEWSGNKDFRAFAKLCGELGLWVYPRVGPWCHGEVRNGATPDWILKKELVGNRTNEPAYQNYIERYFKQITRQCEGLLYKDGGPIIGVQLENEYWRGKGGEAHILWLKETLRKNGMDVPLYTVTGWGNVSVPEHEVIPLYGGYPEEPWTANINKPSANDVFLFDTNRDSEAIGNEQLRKDGKYVVDNTLYPYFTCELGVGNQISYHRRPIIDKRDGLAIALVKVGSGSNLPGYYVFAGGTNPSGKFSPLQEDQHETGMWNEYPTMSYDFQAAIGETGELAQSYYQVKKLHYFLDEFGDVLAPYQPSFPVASDRYKNLQWSVRSDGQRGFLFGLNYIRGTKKEELKGVQFDVKLEDGTSLKFPSIPMNIADSSMFIFPFNFSMNGVNLSYATAQLLSSPDKNSWVFYQEQNLTPEFAFATKDVTKIISSSGKVAKKGDNWVVAGIKAGIGESITINATDGSVRNIYLLSDKQAQQSWLFKNGKTKRFFVSDADLTIDGGNLMLTTTKHSAKLYAFGDVQLSDSKISKIDSPNGWSAYSVAVNTKATPKLTLTQKSVFDGASHIKVNVDEVISKQQLWHRFFYKEFGLYNSADIRSAKLYLNSEIKPTVRLNGKYVNQNSEIIDITGYVAKGENRVDISFPITQTPVSMVGVIEVTFHNGDKITIPTDKGWYVATQYVASATWTSLKGATPVEILTQAKPIPVTESTKRYELSVPYSAFGGLCNLYLAVNYSGDLGRCYLNHRLVWDNFNNGMEWRMNLKTLGTEIEGAILKFEINPIPSDAQIRFDKIKVGKDAAILNWKVVPEYKIILPL